MSDERPFYTPGLHVDPPTTQPRRVLGRLWSRRKGDVTLICVIVEAPVGEELRIMQGEELYRTELCACREAVLQRAETMRLQLEARGWLPVSSQRL
jgi:hypothetical protein